jgi:hypothetical protein
MDKELQRMDLLRCSFKSTKAKRRNFILMTTIIIHDYKDIKVGSELGLVCTLCNDAIMGTHPNSSYAINKKIIG